jgi:hypothetical protein
MGLQVTIDKRPPCLAVDGSPADVSASDGVRRPGAAVGHTEERGLSGAVGHGHVIANGVGAGGVSRVDERDGTPARRGFVLLHRFQAWHTRTGCHGGPVW